MSVPVWQRGISKTDFVYEPYQLVIRLVEITANKPKKYKGTFSDQLLKTAMDALKCLQMANEIFLTENSPPQDFMLRRKYLQVGRGYIKNVSTIFYIFIETVRRHDSENDDRLHKQELEIGDTCNEIIKRVDGLIRSDSDLYKKYIKAKSH